MSVETTGCTTGGTPETGAEVPRARPCPPGPSTPAGTRPSRPDVRRETVRPAGRPGPGRTATALPPVRPRVGGGTARAVVACGPPIAVVRRRRAVATVVLALVLGVLVGVLVSLVGPTSGAVPGVAVPARTTVTVVSGGESLTDVARRVSPGVDAEVVVARIRELNGVSGSLVAPGRPLVVPVGTTAP